MKRVIYPRSRAVEHAAALPGVQPLRLFPVLWPLWRAETSAFIHEEQDYEVIDHFLARAIHGGGITGRAELARFFTLRPSLINGCLGFLERIGHLEVDGDQVSLTEVGQRSIQAGIRYVPKESQQRIFVDQFTGQPLPRRYYSRQCPILDSEPEAQQLAEPIRFSTVFVADVFRDEMVTQLASVPNRTDFNLPGELRDLRVLGNTNACLPTYVIETASHGLLVYTNLAEEHDSYLGGICQHVAIAHRIDADDSPDARAVWTDWLAAHGPGHLRPAANGTGGYRLVLSAQAFGDNGKHSITKLGSYWFERNLFAQLWCDDAALRLRATRERGVRIAALPEVDSHGALLDRVGHIAHALEVRPPTFTELRAHADNSSDIRHLAHLAALTA